MAPKGYRIRMMEPGEAEALHRLRQEADAGQTRPSLAEFVGFLVSHEIFVAAAKKTGEVVGYAAARDAVELYLVVEIKVRPSLGDTAVAQSLLDVVTQRARWFHHRAIGLWTPLDSANDSSCYGKHGFMNVSRKDFPVGLQDELEPAPGHPETTANRQFRVKWL
ncbi:hypothetical protein E3C22_13175 [Jiella endophytica]|uniref:N-acetyltransferase domain-containing protein n=1 Tax=Jiella endophytica TaxID=2558362 RepID=A0A4Y8RFX6_9HYPH|nr:hypothetical protein [Jiella endophytica]TFF21642.1 hypothetical protein E3C22_13175 [Jiella endophytica]